VYRTARISAEKEHQALHDPLTDLPNRSSFDDTLQRRAAQDRRQAPRAAVLLIDLDRFKEVNDTLGHQAGDELLRQIGPRLHGVVPDGATISRFGGDEFAVLLPEVADEAEAHAVALRLSHSIEEPFRVDGFNLEVQASIGVALFPDHGTLSDELIKRADIAMYVAKRLQTGAEIYDPEQDHHSTRRLELVSELRKAIMDGEIVLYYQPKLDLATGRVQSAEALVRWMHPRLGLVPPSEFVPVAEHTGLIRPLTSYVLTTAVRQAAAWRTAGREIAVAVNLSARNLHDGGIITEVPVNLSRFGLPSRLLRLEITESSIMADPVRARKSLDALHDMGVGLSIDDFGTGYSSLAYLQNLPVSEIKIDRSFVMNLVDNLADQAIVRSTIELAKNLGLTSTAEGVETEEALCWLRRTGCDQAQGYHVARPMTAESMNRWLDERDGLVHIPATVGRDLSFSPGGAGC
jgi:diguanylate cyclase (GGDEF)-like protein